MRTRRRPQPPDAPTGAGGIDVGSASSVGGRAENQDRCFVDEQLAVVTDGMGGHRGGATAAELTLDAVLGARDAIESEDGELIDLFTAANDAVRAGRDADPERRTMGATLTLAIRTVSSAASSTWVVAHAGDSPALVVRRGGAEQITVDHTVPAQLLADGYLSPEEAARHPYRNALIRAIGVEERIEADATAVVLGPGDAMVLCSDGLTGVLDHERIAAVVVGSASASDAAAALVDEAVAGGATDNVTAVVVRQRSA